MTTHKKPTPHSILLVPALFAIHLAPLPANGRNPAAYIQHVFSDSLDVVLKQNDYTPIPLERQGNAHFVNAKIDTVALQLLLDSGFSSTMSLEKATTDAVNVHGAPYRVLVGPGAQTGPVTDTTHLRRLTIGTLHFDNLPLTIEGTQGNPINQSLGGQFLQDQNAILDYEHDVLYVHPTSKPLPQVTIQRPGDIAIPFKRLAMKSGSVNRVRYVVQGVVQSKTILLLIDTGVGPYMGVDTKRADELNMLAGTTTDRGYGTAGDFQIQNGVLPHLKLGSLNVDSLQFSAIDLSDVRARERQDGIEAFDGMLGFSFLASRGALIDFGHNMLYLRSK